METSKATPRERLLATAETAQKEVEWFYTCAKGAVPAAGEASPAVRRAAAIINGWLNTIATFHAGALALRYTPREWPAAIKQAFRGWSSLIVRLECAAHSNDGTTRSLDELETEAAGRLEQALVAKRPEDSHLRWLERHAVKHVDAALRAYVEVRGFGPSVLPSESEVT